MKFRRITCRAGAPPPPRPHPRRRRSLLLRRSRIIFFKKTYLFTFYGNCLCLVLFYLVVYFDPPFVREFVHPIQVGVNVLDQLQNRILFN